MFIIPAILLISSCVASKRLSQLQVDHSPYLVTPSLVCYQHLGCFSLNGTFKNVMEVLPDTPEQVGTTFLLFTRHNRDVGQEMSYSDEGTLTTQLFQSYRTTYIIVHGHNDVGLSGSRLATKAALLEHSDCQVLIVDWRQGSAREYWQSAVNTELVGRQVARLVDLLKTRRSLDPAQVHLIGFSLGAQAVGFAGKWTQDALGFRIGRITALDPAGLLFEDSGVGVHIWKEDATFVDAIHTSGGRNVILGELGMEKAVGHVDFYPNGGKAQPGCPQFHPDCSHLRAESLFTESVSSAGRCLFSSVPCAGGPEAFLKGECTTCESQGCGQMGLASRTAPGRGVQFLDINGRSPFCKIN